MSLKFFFAGAEVGSHRKLFVTNEVQHVSMSYVGLSRRIKFSRPWPIAGHFPEYQNVFLDSGTHTLNKADVKIDEEAVRNMAAAYMAFALENISRVTMVSEFDAQMLGREWILAMREDFWNELPRDKFLPIWHSDDGLDVLSEMAGTYSRIGIQQGDVGGADIAHTLNRLARDGVLLHGVGMTKMEPMAAIAWDSVGSMSWNSPVMNGDTIIWDGHKLHRYPKSRKEAARLRHRSYLAGLGFNTDAIEADSGPESVAEIQRLSIWSWLKFVDDINNRKLLHPFGEVTGPPPGADVDISEEPFIQVDNPPVTGTNGDLVPTEVENRETTLIPIMGVDLHTMIGQGGATVEEPRLNVRSKSMRVCDTCFLKDHCPGYKLNSTCLYDIPIEIKSKTQLIAVRDALITMQVQRVLFLQMSEQIQGGYPDQNLSAEMDRLRRMIKDRFDSEREGIIITGPQVRASGGQGYLSSLLGSDVADRMTALPEPIDADEFMKASEIWDGEVVE